MFHENTEAKIGLNDLKRKPVEKKTLQNGIVFVERWKCFCTESHNNGICQGGLAAPKASSGRENSDLQYRQPTQVQPFLSLNRQYCRLQKCIYMHIYRNFLLITDLTCLCFSLRCGRRVCYLGWGPLAVLGLIDASECNPTFGAGERDVLVSRKNNVASFAAWMNTASKCKTVCGEHPEMHFIRCK